MTRDEYLFYLRDFYVTENHSALLSVPSLGLKNLKPVSCIISSNGIAAEMEDETGATYQVPVSKVYQQIDAGT